MEVINEWLERKVRKLIRRQIVNIFFSTLQNIVCKLTNMATCRLCLTNLRPVRTVRNACFLCFTCFWPLAPSSHNLGSPITKCEAAGELVNDYILLFSHDKHQILLQVFVEDFRHVTIWFNCVTVYFATCICNLI